MTDRALAHRALADAVAAARIEARDALAQRDADHAEALARIVAEQQTPETAALEARVAELSDALRKASDGPSSADSTRQ